MLYLQIVIWTLLVILGISYIATLITPLNTAEKDAKISYLYLLSCVLSSAIFVLLKELFLIDTAVFVWKILSIIPLCLILIICFFYKRKSVNNIFSFLGVLLLGIIPFLINLNITPSEVLLPSLKNTYSLDVIIISFVAFAAILLYMVARLLIRKNRTILESIEYLSNIVKDAENLN
ncbi:putative membrane protein, partial [Bacteroides fragilis str. 3988 T1]